MLVKCYSLFLILSIPWIYGYIVNLWSYNMTTEIEQNDPQKMSKVFHWNGFPATTGSWSPGLFRLPRPDVELDESISCIFDRHLSSWPLSPVCPANWQITSSISSIWPILCGSWVSCLADPKSISRESPPECTSPDSLATSFLERINVHCKCAPWHGYLKRHSFYWDKWLVPVSKLVS